MRVVLLQNVPGTGEIGQVKEVADGYARNFLLRRKLAKAATVEVMQQMAVQEQKRMKTMERELKSNQKQAGNIDGAEIEIIVPTSQGKTLYSAIGAKVLCQELNKQLKIDINQNQIVLKKSIKECGDYEIQIKFGHGLEAGVRVRVVPE